MMAVYGGGGRCGRVRYTRISVSILYLYTVEILSE